VLDWPPPQTVARLAARHRPVSKEEVITVLREAREAVLRVTGIDDRASATDLADLRLQVRATIR
jgi:hypothetical protein